VNTPTEEALRRAYYYTETGAWRGPLTEEQDRWCAVAKVAAEQVAAERERCAKLCDAYESGGQDWAAIAAGELAREIRGAGDAP
jgi:hypothetical protein